jgi:hypothetical protein
VSGGRKKIQKSSDNSLVAVKKVIEEGWQREYRLYIEAKG